MPAMEESVEVTRGTVRDLPALEDVWLAVHHHHAKTMPELAPYVDDAVSWRTRADLYADLLAKPTTVLLLTHDAGSLVGLRTGPRYAGGGDMARRHMDNRLPSR